MKPTRAPGASQRARSKPSPSVPASSQRARSKPSPSAASDASATSGAPPARRAYSSPAREAGAHRTRTDILEAFVHQLGRPGASDFSVAEAARAAGVSVRTVHHHFPDRRARVEALAAWAEETFGPLVAPLETPDDLPAFVRAAYERAGRHLELTRAMYVTGLGNEIRLTRLKARRARIHGLLATLGASAAETRRAAAVVAMLASSEAGVPLIDMHGLDLATAGEAAAEAVEAIVARLAQVGRRRRATKP